MSDRRRPGPAGRRLVLAGLALGVALLGIPAAALLPTGGPLAAPTAAAASTGLTLAGDTRYVVDAAKRRVHVSVALTATNHRSDTKTHRFYYDRAYLAVQPSTAGYRVSSSGIHPSVAVTKRTATYTLLRIDFGKQLGAGATRRFSLTFDLIDPGGAPTRTTRIGSTLVSFAAWGLSGEGSPGGSVTVIFPKGFTIDVDAPGLGAPQTDPAGNVTYATGHLANPLKFFAYFIADRPGAYRETRLSVPIGGRAVPVTIRAWPDDPTWATRVGSLLRRGLPALATEIGLPWTVDQPLIVQEAVSRSTSGFAGRYNPPTGQIEIAYYATPFVILHEAAHAWFDGSLLADRWASEGFASYYALRAAKAIGEKGVAGNALTPALEKIRQPLNAWGPPDPAGGAAEDAEYAAALRVASLVAKRAGDDGLQAVWRAIRDARATYQPTGPDAPFETAAVVPDWRGLLDLFQDQTGVSYDDLWTAWVLRASEPTLLADRSDARIAYAATLARAGTWTLPRVVRDALRAWQFGQVSTLLASANRALDDRDAVAAAATTAGLTPPPTMEVAFEGPRGFAAASAEAEAELAAIKAYDDAAATRLSSPGLIESVGLWNGDPDGALHDAATAFAAGDLQQSVQSAALASRIWTTAGEVGRNRLLAIVASLAAILLGTAIVIRWFRDRRLHRRRAFVIGRG